MSSCLPAVSEQRALVSSLHVLGGVFWVNGSEWACGSHHFDDRASVCTRQQPDCLDSGHVWDRRSPCTTTRGLLWVDDAPASMDRRRACRAGDWISDILDSTFRRSWIPLLRWRNQSLCQDSAEQVLERQHAAGWQVRLFCSSSKHWKISTVSCTRLKACRHKAKKSAELKISLGIQDLSPRWRFGVESFPKSRNSVCFWLTILPERCTVFTARSYASAIYAVVVVYASVCLSVRMSDTRRCVPTVKSRITQATVIFWLQISRRNSSGVTGHP